MSKVRVNVVATKDDTQSVEVHRLVAAPDKIEALEQRVPDIDAAVKRTSSTGAASMPVGSEAQRPGTAGNGMFRYNSDKHQFEGYQNGKWGAIGGGSHVLSVTWEPSRDILGEGFVAADGQTLSRATFPDAWAAIAAGKVPVVDDATWLADVTQRGKFSLGDGATTFRVPDYNGKSAGSLGAVFLRGDGALSAGQAGLIQRDAFQGHALYVNGAVSGFVNSGVVGNGTDRSAVRLGTSAEQQEWREDSAGNGVPRVASETRPLNVTGCWVIKLFGAVVNVGSADAAQLATDYANLAAQVQTAYKPSNLVGIVSQAGGVPTGAVIERGSNANGEYIRFADGTQICKYNLPFTIPNSTEVLLVWSYPAAFVDLPTVTGIWQGGRPGAAIPVVGNLSPLSELSVQFNAYSVSGGSFGGVGLSRTILALAVGRWY